MKQFFILYTIIGLILTPFIHSNNAQEYRNQISTAHGWGLALGGAFYWPSYLFSIEPEVDGDSLHSFTESINEMVQYRNDKLFTGKGSNEHAYMLIGAINNCMILEYTGKKKVSSLFDKILDEAGTEDAEILRSAILVSKKLDGYDFADVIEEGVDCGRKIRNR